ncbi:unnamed protein product [Arabis nemorensis]|uniref:Uncharacterized protein n=1 Tax=Arabis nemorensis TaxID=586526 RepID=A0A565CAR3_9BRAS|nr:unnamed protein product [Arabis nemorensis]
MEEASIHKWLLLLQLPSLTYFRHRFKMGISLEKVLSVVLSLLNSESGKQPYWSAYEGDRKLREGEFIVQICMAIKDCVSKTLKRLEEKIHGRVIRHLMYLMQISERPIQRRVALAHLCSAEDPYSLMTKA